MVVAFFTNVYTVETWFLRKLANRETRFKSSRAHQFYFDGGLGTLARFTEGAFHILTDFARAFLDAADQFIFFAVDELKIIVGKFGPFLFHFAFGDIPITFNLKFIHNFLIRFDVFLTESLILDLRTADRIGGLIPGIGGSVLRRVPRVRGGIFCVLPSIRGAFFRILRGRISLRCRIFAGAVGLVASRGRQGQNSHK
jgi:hypothetical protein